MNSIRKKLPFLKIEVQNIECCNNKNNNEETNIESKVYEEVDFEKKEDNCCCLTILIKKKTKIKNAKKEDKASKQKNISTKRNEI